jgi:hypothetical protein
LEVTKAPGSEAAHALRSPPVAGAADRRRRAARALI